ncbi:hypothetical protein H1P_960015 [Hyella patelloides LEGE 07179]|uniref:Uncharacterized protein n=1 Tax=Hyella patelloides LEGE 07179 TaxID=945734 RepID=A0A563W5I1_9CYAN|nr:hypothetical protein H1P_960015 [Hyella patelloides LEGE 07179]
MTKESIEESELREISHIKDKIRHRIKINLKMLDTDLK